MTATPQPTVTKSVLDVLHQSGFPISCASAAVRVLYEQFDRKSQFDQMICGLTGIKVVTVDYTEARALCGYLVQEPIKSAQKGIVLDGQAALDLAKEKTVAFIQQHVYTSANNDATDPNTIGMSVGTRTTSKTVGEPSKRDRAIALFKEHADAGRKELIALFVVAIGLTPAGASTYVHNCKSGLWT